MKSDRVKVMVENPGPGWPERRRGLALWIANLRKEPRGNDAMACVLLELLADLEIVLAEIGCRERQADLADR